MLEGRELGATVTAAELWYFCMMAEGFQAISKMKRGEMQFHRKQLEKGGFCAFETGTSAVADGS